MEIAVHPQPLLASHIQPSLQATVLYPGKDSVWQPVVTSIPPLADIPKESIIANTDFTTTSLIAKRRLSSKKRKKQEGSVGGGANSEGSTHSNSSPIPAAHESAQMDVSSASQRRSSNGAENAACTSMMTSTSMAFNASVPAHMVHQHTHSHTHHVAPPPGGIPLRTMPGGQYIPVVSTAGSCYPVAPNAAGLVPKQFVNPVLNQLQQELNYRFLQEQSSMMVHPAGFSVPYSTATTTSSMGPVPHPHPHTTTRPNTSQSSEVAMATDSSSSSLDKPAGFKWCCAHVYIAKKIQEHQQQTNVTVATVATHSRDTSLSRQGQEFGRQSTQPDAAMVAQQLALLQVYGMQPNMATVPGYMAVPYSMQEVQLRMQSFMPPSAVEPLGGNAGIPLVKPADGAPNQMAVDSSLNLNSVPMMNGMHFQTPFTQSVPMAAAGLAPSDLNSIMMQGTAGSWVAPVPVIGSCIINNPFQPGIMATSWVK